MEIAQAYIQVLPTTEGIGSNLTAALSGVADSAGEAAGKSAGGKLAGALGSAAKIGAAAVGAVAAGTSAMGAAVVKATGDVAAYGDNIDKMSQKMGLTAEAYQEWDAVMQHSGTSMETMKASMKTLASAAETNSKAFGKLGISQKEIADMSQQDLFEATIAALQNVEDETERTYLAGQVLGRGATELGALLNTSAEDTQAMRDRVHELGGVMSDDAVKAAAAYQDSLQDMQTAVSGAGRTIVSDFLPSVAEVMNGIGNIFSGDSETGIGQVGAGIDSMIGTVTEKVPEVAAVGGQIVGAIGTAIGDNLPLIMDAGVQVLLMLLTGLLGALPGALDAGTQIITTVCQGLEQALPELIPAAFDAVLTVGEGIVANAPQLITSAITLMTTLGVGLVNALPNVLQRVPTIIVGLVNALVGAAPQIVGAGVTLLTALVRNMPQIVSTIVRAVPQIITGILGAISGAVGQMVSAGAQLMAGLGQGLINGIKGVINKAKEAAGQVLGAIKGFFGIHSPSWITDGYGRQLDAGLGNGIFDAIGGVVEKARRAAAKVLDALKPKDPVEIRPKIEFEPPELSEPQATVARTLAKVSAASPPAMVAGGDNRELAEVIRLLGALIAEVKDKHLTVDAQSLVTGLTPMINRRLGDIAEQQEREVYA